MDDQPEWLKTVFAGFKIPFGQRLTRSEIYNLNEENRWMVFGALKSEFARNPEICAQLGLRPGVPRYNSDGSRRASRGRNVTTFDVFNVRPVRRASPDGSVRVDIVAVVTQRRPEPIIEGGRIEDGFFWFRSGSTLVLDSNLGQPRIRYNIVKGPDSARRLAIQRTMEAGGFAAPLRSLYFGADRREPFALLHDGHRGTPHA
jgi:hypothetical protein